MSNTETTSTQEVQTNAEHQYGAFYQIPIERFFQFALSVDNVILGYHENALKLLVIERGAEPHKGKLALPGDLVYPNEDVDFAVRRVLKDLTGLTDVFMTQTNTYGQVGRHPIGRVVTVAYYSLVNADKYQPLANSWADHVSWIDLETVPQLAFDHNQIVQDAIIALRERVRTQPIGFELLPEKFTLGEMQLLYEAILGEKYDKANFRKRILSMGLLKDLKEMQTDVPHRPARLFSFDEQKYIDLKSKGFSFGL